MTHKSALLRSFTLLCIISAAAIHAASAAPPSPVPVPFPNRAAASNNGVPGQLGKIENLLQQVLNALAPPTPTPQNQTRLLFPFVTNQAGFDTGIVVSNTGLDSTGVIGKAGTCTIYYFGTGPGGTPAGPPQTTNAAIAPGGQLTFVVSSGGNFGIAGRPGFQGYIEIVCDFPFAHGYALLTDGPIGAARIGSAIPALVIPNQRTNSFEESAGQ